MSNYYIIKICYGHPHNKNNDYFYATCISTKSFDLKELIHADNKIIEIRNRTLDKNEGLIIQNTTYIKCDSIISLNCNEITELALKNWLQNKNLPEAKCDDFIKKEIASDLVNPFL